MKRLLHASQVFFIVGVGCLYSQLTYAQTSLTENRCTPAPAFRNQNRDLYSRWAQPLSQCYSGATATSTYADLAAACLAATDANCDGTQGSGMSLDCYGTGVNSGCTARGCCTLQASGTAIGACTKTGPACTTTGTSTTRTNLLVGVTAIANMTSSDCNLMNWLEWFREG